MSQRRAAAVDRCSSIAGRLDIAEATVRSHIHNVLTKTNTTSGLEAVAAARDHGLIP